MRAILTATVGLAFLSQASAAQDPWAEPISAPWPLADLALQPTAQGGIQLFALPNPITAQSDTADTYLTLELVPAVVAAWIPRARRFVDSVLGGPRDLHDPIAGLSLQTDSGTGKITLAHQPNTRPWSRFLLVITPPPPAHGWSVQGGEEAARRFLRALDSAVARSAVRTRPDSVEGPLADCAGIPPQLTHGPRMDLPTRKRLGGRVLLEFVIDMTGAPIPETVRVLLSSGAEYTREVRRHLPDLRYAPGVCNGAAVRVLVHQGFAFRLDLRR